MADTKTAQGAVGAKMKELLDVPSFAKGLTPQMLFDLAKDKKIITKEQQADFKNRVGKDRTALACLLYTSPSPRDGLLSRMPSSA